jgi:hypothetical protein
MAIVASLSLFASKKKMFNCEGYSEPFPSSDLAGL